MRCKGEGRMRIKTLLIGIIGIILLISPLSSQVWQKTIRVTWSSSWSKSPTIVVDSNNKIHLVYHDYTPGNEEIFYESSTDGGSSWTTKRLTWNTRGSYVPTLAIDSNNHIHLVWHDLSPGNPAEIFYKKSTDGGSSWATKRLTWNSEDSSEPNIVVDSNDHIHLVWSDYSPGNAEIFYKRSTDGGVTWEAAKRLTWTSGFSYGLSIAVDSNDHIHVVWNDDSPGNREIYYKKSTSGGASWTSKRLTWNSEDSLRPSITVDSYDHIHVVWHDFVTPTNGEIFYKRSTDGGSSWLKKRLTWNSGSSHSSVIASDSNNYLHVAWSDYTPGNAEIFYKRSTDGGTNWFTMRMTFNSGRSLAPYLTVSPYNDVYLVWEDETPGNFEIYYRKRIQ
jgi:hypothetical protein